MKKKYDAIVVLSGGIDGKGIPYKWAKRRLRAAADAKQDVPIIVTSRGTTHKPAILRKGDPITEASAAAAYLLSRAVPKERILQEDMAYDTIGNAYFTRCIHTDPAGFRKLLIITSQFHMPRAKEIFEWVFRLNAPKPPYALDFMAVSDEGIDREILLPRMEKERARIAHLAAVKKRIRTMRALHAWMYKEHAAYATGLIPEKAPKKTLRSY